MVLKTRPPAYFPEDPDYRDTFSRPGYNALPPVTNPYLGISVPLSIIGLLIPGLDLLAAFFGWRGRSWAKSNFALGEEQGTGAMIVGLTAFFLKVLLLSIWVYHTRF